MSKRNVQGAASVDLLARVSAEIHARRDELNAAVVEHAELLQALDAIDGERAVAVDAPAKPTGTRGRKPKAQAKASAKAKAQAKPKAAPKALPAPPAGEHHVAILAALEHGSHTVNELTVVTGLAGGVVRDGLKALIKAGSVGRSTREGKTAYTLPA